MDLYLQLVVFCLMRVKGQPFQVLGVDLEMGRVLAFQTIHEFVHLVLFLENDVPPLPILHHPQSLQSAYYVVRVNRHFLANICNTKQLIITLGTNNAL